MTPITREQARELAEKHGAELLHGRGFVMSPSQSVAMLTDFAEQVRQQFISDLEKMNSGLPAFKIMALQAKIDRLEEERDTAATDRFDEMADLRAKLEQSEARRLELEKDAARWNHYRNLAGPEAPNPFWCLRVIPGEVDRLADAALNKEPGHEA